MRPHRWAPWAQQLLLDADEVVVVGTLDLASLRDTKNLVERLKEKRGDGAPVRMVLSKSGMAKRTELYKQAQAIFHDDAPWVPVAHSVVHMPMSKKVSGAA